MNDYSGLVKPLRYCQNSKSPLVGFAWLTTGPILQGAHAIFVLTDFVIFLRILETGARKEYIPAKTRHFSALDTLLPPLLTHY
jgi:hypothetical protein